MRHIAFYVDRTRINVLPTKTKNFSTAHCCEKAEGKKSFFFPRKAFKMGNNILVFLSVGYLLTIVQEVSNLVLDVAAKITNTVQDMDLAFV